MKNLSSILRIMDENSPFSVGILRFANQVLIVVKQSALRLPTRALLLWGNLSRDQLLQKAYSLSYLIFSWCKQNTKLGHTRKHQRPREITPVLNISKRTKNVLNSSPMIKILPINVCPNSLSDRKTTTTVARTIKHAHASEFSLKS